MAPQTGHTYDHDLGLESGNGQSTAAQPPETTERGVQSVRHEEQVVPSAGDSHGADRAGAALIHVNDLMEMEVRRIAHALHDEAGQTLTLVHLKLAEIERLTSSQGTPGFGEVRQLLDRIEEQLGQLSHELRPVILDELGLVPALESLADNFGKRTGLDIAVIATTRGRFPTALETALYRIVQETLINANRHARARHITVQIRVEAGMVHCSVSDDGAGFDCESAKGGLGLLGIRERLVHLGGRLTINSRIGEGTRIAVAIPMERS
ncbi:MAG TPA: sensor histidine kinase [Candidatus Acidoferrales bacterium]|jgi:signal transduction histidine kinase|nr:sensor histidine kinase [Candidatus Acidoferrales bacterium]